MDIDLGSLAIMGLLLVAPAVVVLAVATILRVRRGKFRRQRITKNSSRKRA
jgi:hypothetical protein